MDATPRGVPTAAARPRGMPGRLWTASPPLAVVGVLMLLAAGAFAIAMRLDPRVITGAPAWRNWQTR